MTNPATRSFCWKPTWNKERDGLGLEHLVLSQQAADSVVLAFDDGLVPFRLTYQLRWDARWRLRDAEMTVATDGATRSLSLRTDGEGLWRDAQDQPLPALDGCLDIDIWPTPFTNTFPLRRAPLAVGERREFRMAWVLAPDLTVQALPQAYTRLSERRYLFENLDGSGFRVELPVDGDGIVLDYPGLFERIGTVR